MAVAFEVGGVACTVGGMAKGAGMIAPRMATMLAFFTTDAAVETEPLRRALASAVGESLNRVTVDGDTSTNDCAVLLAGGASGARPIAGEGPDLDAFRSALAGAARQLAWLLIHDGEGVTRVAEVRVEGARTPQEADRVARVVAESPLVKTALHGGDPNWGRILAALGRAGVALDADRVSIWLGDVWVAERRRGPRLRRRRMRPGPCSRTRCASGSASARATPPAGSGPPTSRADTWTSTRTTGAEGAR